MGTAITASPLSQDAIKIDPKCLPVARKLSTTAIRTFLARNKKGFVRALSD
jgi:hypothetical protein